jgi:hypothetical protein
MPRIFYPSSEKLRFLLDSIHNREVALPDFQRDFVWDPSATEELIESICENFPAGSLLRIKNSADFYFAPREFAGAPPLNGHAPSYLILDGQQRLTSLYQAFYGKGNYRFLIRLGGLIDQQPLEDCVFYVRKPEAEKHFTFGQQAATLTFPLQLLFGGSNSFEDWLDQVLDARIEPDSEKRELKKKLRDTRSTWLENIEHYEFPMVTLGEETKVEAVCTIFETLNRTGVKLSVFDLLAARFWPVDVRLRDLWEQAKKTHPIVEEFEIDPYYLLQVASICTAAGAPSCKRSDVLRMQVSQITNGWQASVTGMAAALQALQADCGVMLPKWLPYNTIVVPAAAAFAVWAAASGPLKGALKNKIERWFWCSVFGQKYETAANSQSVKDYTELKAWFQGGVPPETVAAFHFDPDTLRETGVRQRALYRGTMALVMRSGARDFHTGDLINARQMEVKKIDDHHIFPRGFLAQLPSPPSGALQDCVLNRTLIDKETNIRIGKRPPSDYLLEIEAEIGPTKLKEILDSHLLPSGLDSTLRRDDFEGFLQERQALIDQKIREVTQ